VTIGASDRVDAEPFAAFERRKYALLTTFRRDGRGVATPVTIAVAGPIAYVRTYDKTGKAKRLRNFPNVLVAPCTARGKPRSEAVRAAARLLDGDDARVAKRALARRQPVLQGVLVPALHRVMRYRTLHYALTAGHVPGGSPAP